MIGAKRYQTYPKFCVQSVNNIFILCGIYITNDINVGSTEYGIHFPYIAPYHTSPYKLVCHMNVMKSYYIQSYSN